MLSRSDQRDDCSREHERCQILLTALALERVQRKRSRTRRTLHYIRLPSRDFCRVLHPRQVKVLRKIFRLATIPHALRICTLYSFNITLPTSESNSSRSLKIALPDHRTIPAQGGRSAAGLGRIFLWLPSQHTMRACVLQRSSRW
jgi:hypothetical protein